MKTLIYFLLLSPNLFGQIDLKFNNNFTGIFSSNLTKSIGFNYVGNNSIEYKKASLDINTNYALRLEAGLKEHEFSQRQGISWYFKKYNLFVTHQYNYSLLRNIHSDNWLGLGLGIRPALKAGKLSLSYATIYQNTLLSGGERAAQFRHSLRVKIKLVKKNISFSSEFFYQPALSDFNDMIITGNTQISFFIQKPVNFIIQDVVNYINRSNIILVHNLTLGIAYKFDKSFDKKVDLK